MALPIRAHVKNEIHTAGQVVLGAGIVALVIVGIGGTIYKVIAPDGWVSHAFGRSLSAGAASLGSLLLIGALAWFSRGVTSPRTRNRYADVLVYAAAAAGLFYLAQLWTKGTF
jgi:hypothetical protein